MCRQCSKITEIFSYLNCFWLFLDRSSRMTLQKFMETTYYVPNNSKGLKIYDPSKGCSMILKVGHCFLVIKSVLFYLCAQNKTKQKKTTYLLILFSHKLDEVPSNATSLKIILSNLICCIA